MQATGIILDTLKKYNIKATFFVLDFTDEEIPLLKRMVEEGHSIGIHGYSHEYDKIYTSVDAFMENITKLSDRLENEIGVKPNIIRFPGGSSNTTSIKYCKGIMTELTRLVCEKGYQYFDWNVSPEDAMSKMTPEEISSAVIDGLRSSRKENVVLMHDAEAQKSTALAVEAIVQYGIANGYRFDKLTVDTPPVHHSISTDIKKGSDIPVKEFIFYSDSSEATKRVGFALGRVLVKGDIVLLDGGLGAGKTCLTGGLAAALEIPEPGRESYIYVGNEYFSGKIHFFTMMPTDFHQETSCMI